MLLKALYSSNPQKLAAAVKRFQQLPEFKQLSIAALQQTEIKRKHALTIIAQENGFARWDVLKKQLPIQLFFVKGGHLTHWFSNYMQAKTYQEYHGGFLFPHLHQAFICDVDYIKNLGLDPSDPDWQAIEFDWAKPVDNKAYRRLLKQVEAIIK